MDVGSDGKAFALGSRRVVVVLVHRNFAMRTFEILNIKYSNCYYVNYLVAAQLQLVLYSSFAGFNLQYTSGEWGGGLLTEELVDSGFFVSQHCQRVSVHLRNIYFTYIYIYFEVYA